jgi:hypothetical protein
MSRHSQGTVEPSTNHFQGLILVPLLVSLATSSTLQVLSYYIFSWVAMKFYLLRSGVGKFCFYRLLFRPLEKLIHLF